MLSLTVYFQGSAQLVAQSSGPPAHVSALTELGQGQGGVRVEFVLVEDSPHLSTVSSVVDWGDGTREAMPARPDRRSQTAVLVHSYPPGSYLLSIRGQNYQVNPVFVEVSAAVQVQGGQARGEPAAASLFGPVLPRDAGLPNADQWQFDRGEELQVLESAVKALLLTAQGERVCEPNYGTRLRRSIFSSDPSTVASTVVEDITAALAAWEPRVGLRDAKVLVAGRTATVDAVFVARSTNAQFGLAVQFNQ